MAPDTDARPRGRWLPRIALSVAVCTASSPAPADPPSRVALTRIPLGPARWSAGLRDPDARVRASSVRMLGSSGRAHDVRIQLGTLINTETDPVVLLAVTDVLARALGPDGIAALGTLATRPVAAPYAYELGNAALVALGHAGPRSVVTLLDVRGAETSPAADAAARGLAALDEATFSQVVSAEHSRASQMVRLLRAVALRGDPRWGTFVIAQFRDSDAAVLSAACDASAVLALTEATAPLLELARDARDAGVRRAALHALGAIGLPVPADVVRTALATPATRASALAMCAALGDRETAPFVTQQLGAQWAGDRIAAASALGSIGGDEAIAALVARLGEGREGDVEVRAEVRHALARLANATTNATTNATVMRALATSVLTPDETWDVVEAVVRSGGTTAGLRVSSGSAAGLVLAARTGGADWLAAIGSHDADVRLAGAFAAAVDVAHDANGEQLAATLAHEDDEAVRIAIVQALAARGGDVARAELFALVRGDEAPPGYATVVAAQALARSRFAGMGEAALAWVDDPRPMVRAIAYGVIAAARPAGAAARLEHAAYDELDEGARIAALTAYARYDRERSLEALASAARTAWTNELAGGVERARAMAAGGAEPGDLRGDEVLRARGLAPRSIHGAVLVDGSVRIAVVDGDGALFVAGLPSDAVTFSLLGAP